jgi:hypothetical protein
MARINIRLEDGLLERVKGAVPEGQMSAWLVGLMEVALDGPKQEDLTIARVMKRLDALEDFRVYIEGRIAKSEAPMRRDGPVPLPGRAVEPFRKLTVESDNA